MRRPGRLRRLGSVAGVLLALANPGFAQDIPRTGAGGAGALPDLEQGGRHVSLAVRQGLETARNPTLDPERNGAGEISATTDLDLRLSSVTRRAGIALSLGAQLRGAAGDLAPGLEEGLGIDRPRLALGHVYRAPGAVFRTEATLRRDRIGFLRPGELIAQPGGGVELPEDFDTLEGSGFRTEARLRLAARFGETGPLGWDISLRGRALRYAEADAPGLEDSSDLTTGLAARLDLSPALQLRAGLRHTTRRTGGRAAEDTRDLDLALSQRLSETAALRAGLSLAQPEGRDARTTVVLGATRDDGEATADRLDLTLGATIGQDGTARLVGLLDYRRALSRRLDVTARLDRQVRDSRDNETVLDTAARLQLRQALTPQGALAFGVTFGARENFATEETSETTTLSIGYSHALTRDWALTLGASQALRTRSDRDDATSARLFVGLERRWGGRF